MEPSVNEQVRRAYWDENINCARTMLRILRKTFGANIEPQTQCAAIGLHGAGGYRAQCGLVEGSLMFLGLFFAERGKNDADIETLCYRFAERFTERFGSLSCRDLRPGGFRKDDPPHLCESLTGEAARFTIAFIRSQLDEP